MNEPPRRGEQTGKRQHRMVRSAKQNRVRLGKGKRECLRRTEESAKGSGLARGETQDPPSPHGRNRREPSSFGWAVNGGTGHAKEPRKRSWSVDVAVSVANGARAEALVAGET